MLSWLFAPVSRRCPSIRAHRQPALFPQWEKKGPGKSDQVASEPATHPANFLHCTHCAHPTATVSPARCLQLEIKDPGKFDQIVSEYNDLFIELFLNS